MDKHNMDTVKRQLFKSLERMTKTYLLKSSFFKISLTRHNVDRHGKTLLGKNLDHKHNIETFIKV